MSDEEEKVTDVQNNKDEDPEEAMTEEVFAQRNDLLDTGVEAEFQCTEPHPVGGHIVYNCKGADAQGAWEGTRRYNEFFKLHERLEQRWPGIPIPQLPPKKAIGNKDQKFLQDRCYYLERFLKKVSGFEFLTNSKEFLIFSRPAGDIDKLLGQIPKQPTHEIVDKFREVLQISDHLYDPIQKDKLDSQCKEFQSFARGCLPILKTL